jgi:hypothetical protein
MEWVEESDKKLVLLLLDFENVFDRIHWDFLSFVLQTLGFCEQWIHWVSTLYKVATSIIRITREVGDSFSLFRLMQLRCLHFHHTY